ncbi:MAG: TonB-dependent receptor, partial [Massilia sp.]
FSIDSVSPGQIERIEIMRAATAEFSTQAIAGTINIVLKARVSSGKRELKLSAEGDGMFRSEQGNFQLSDKLDKFGYQFTGAFRAADYDETSLQKEEYFDAQDRPLGTRQASPRSRGHYRNLSLTPRLEWTLDNGDTLISQTLVNLQRTRGNRITEWSTPVPYRAEHAGLDDRNDLLRTELNWVRKFDGGAKLDTRAVLNATRRQNDVPEQGFDDALLETLDRTSATSTRERGVSLIGKYTTPIVEGHALSAGWDAGQGRRDEERGQHDRAIAGIVPLNTDQALSARLRRLAVYGQDEWSLTPTWSMYLGLRWEGIAIDSEGAASGVVHHRSSVFSPLFQTLWKFPNRNNDQLRLALTRTYKAPGFGQLIPNRLMVTNNSRITPDTQGNPALKPELATGIDLAYEHFLAAGAMVSASAFVRRISDFIHDDVVLVDGRWVSMPVNDGQAQTRGIAVDGKLPLRALDKQAPDIELRANVSRNWSSVDNVPGHGNRLGRQTPVSANVGVDYKYSASFNMGASFNFRNGGLVRVSRNSSMYGTVSRELELFGVVKLSDATQLRASASSRLKQPISEVKLYDDAAGRSVSTLDIPSAILLRLALEVKL